MSVDATANAEGMVPIMSPVAIEQLPLCQRFQVRFSLMSESTLSTGKIQSTGSIRSAFIGQIDLVG